MGGLGEMGGAERLVFNCKGGWGGDREFVGGLDRKSGRAGGELEGGTVHYYGYLVRITGIIHH